MTAATSVRACSTRRAGREPRDHLRHAMRAALDHHRAQVVLADHHVEQRVDAVGKERRRLQDADHRHRLRRRARTCLPTMLGIAAEALHPVLVRQHHHRRHAGSVVARPREPAEHRRESHHLEVVAGDEPDVDAHGVVVALQRAACHGEYSAMPPSDLAPVAEVA